MKTGAITGPCPIHLKIFFFFWNLVRVLSVSFRECHGAATLLKVQGRRENYCGVELILDIEFLPLLIGH